MLCSRSETAVSPLFHVFSDFLAMFFFTHEEGWANGKERYLSGVQWGVDFWEVTKKMTTDKTYSPSFFFCLCWIYTVLSVWVYSYNLLQPDKAQDE